MSDALVRSRGWASSHCQGTLPSGGVHQLPPEPPPGAPVVAVVAAVVAAIPTIGLLSLKAPADPWNTASPRVKTPPSDATSQQPPPSGVAAIPTIGLLSLRAPVDPWNAAPPREKTPPSEATSQYAPPVSACTPTCACPVGADDISCFGTPEGQCAVSHTGARPSAGAAAEAVRPRDAKQETTEAMITFRPNCPWRGPVAFECESTVWSAGRTRHETVRRLFAGFSTEVPPLPQIEGWSRGKVYLIGSIASSPDLCCLLPTTALCLGTISTARSNVRGEWGGGRIPTRQSGPPDHPGPATRRCVRCPIRAGRAARRRCARPPSGHGWVSAVARRRT